MNVESFVKKLASISFENTFNPYCDQCCVYDFHDSAEKRRLLLKSILEATIKTELDAIWIGRDLGYKGGRRTGLALTDDVNLLHHLSRWEINFERLTRGAPVSEKTATIIWDNLSQIPNPIFLWNVFPLHPHETQNPFSNRAHTSKEREVGEQLLSILIHLLKPKRIIAIGNDAEKSALKLFDNAKVFKVRHPSYGGKNIFISQINALYELQKKQDTQQYLF